MVRSLSVARTPLDRDEFNNSAKFRQNKHRIVRIAAERPARLVPADDLHHLALLHAHLGLGGVAVEAVLAGGEGGRVVRCLGEQN